MAAVKAKSTKRKAPASVAHAEAFALKNARTPGHNFDKLNADVIGDILAMHSAGITMQMACRKHKLSTAAWFQMLQRHRANGTGTELLAAWEEAREQFTLQLELHAESLALQADVRFCTMLIFLLKARKPEVYGDRVKHTASAEGFAEHFANAMNRALNGERPASAPATPATH